MIYRSATRRFASRSFALALVLLMAACASVGRDFPRLDPESLVFGQTTSSEVIAKFGPPQSRSRHSSDSASSVGQVNNDELPAGRHHDPLLLGWTHGLTADPTQGPPKEGASLISKDI